MEEKRDIEELLREREQIDGRLSEYMEKTAVMFTDIKSATDYFDTWGDIEGRLLLQRSEDIMAPIIEKYNGVKKGLGDGILSYYGNADDAVMAATEMLKALQKYNEGKPKKQQIHIRAGINFGEVFVEKGDVYGDVVNVASRIESLADVDSIFVSSTVYDEVKSSDEIICRLVGERTVKGKVEPVRVYKVLWSEEELTVGMVRSAPAVEAAPKEEEDIFFLEFYVEGDTIRAKSYEGATGEQKTLRYYEDSKISIEKTIEESRKIEGLLARANKQGKIGKEILNSLKQAGSLLYDELFPAKTKEALNNTKLTCLVLSLDDRLVHIPWELVFDGKEFLCQRFSLGRVVSTRQEFAAGQREVRLPLKMLLLADPQGNLPAAYKEGVSLRERLESKEELINLSMKSSSISKDYVKGKLRNFDILHYAGHSDYNKDNPSESGYLLEDGKLTAKDIRNMTGRMPLPSFVFSNACHSGQTDQWKVGEGYENIYGLATAFLLSGVRHYLGTFWEIQDEPGLHFALDFYDELMKGSMIGDAVRKARLGLIDRYGEDTIIWACYTFYGDPTFRYVSKSTDARAPQEDRHVAEPVLQSSASRSSEDVVLFPSGQKKIYKTAIPVIVLLAVIAAFLMFRGRQAEPPQTTAVQTVAPAPTVAADTGKSERIDKMVQELASKFRKGEIPAAGKADEWTSAPLSLAFLDLKESGLSGLEKEFIINKVTENLQGSGKLSVVDRELLDRLLEELQLGSSELADPATALKLGRILSARLIATGSIMKEKNEWMMSMRVIETETTSIKSAITFGLETKDKNEVAENISSKLLTKLEKEYPLQAKVLSVKGGEVRINIGSDVGVTDGLRMEVLSPESARLGEVEITSVSGPQASARVISGEESIKEGLRVRELIASK